MTKRRNLFEENCPLQQKMHIGPKEVDHGVDNTHRMRLVYERTRMLLFDGVHRTNSERSITDVNRLPPTTPHSASNRHPLKQLRVDSLISRSRTSRHQFTAADVPESLPISTCTSCCCSNLSKCNFCDKMTCDGCLQRCTNCCGDFCPLCSFKLYDQRDDSAVCLSCSSV